jgi:integrase
MAEYYRGLTAGRGMKKKAFNNVRSIINALLDKAVAEGYCEQNVSRLVNTAGYKYKPTNNSMKVYSSEERDLILGDLKNSDNIYDAAVSMMFCLGCRVSEVKALKWKDIDWAKSTVYICRELVNGPEGQIEKSHTKSGMTEGNRTVPLSERALEILSSIPRTKDEDQYVFQKDLKPLRTESVNTHLRDVCRKLGIEYLSSHKIRAWAITEMVKSGVDEATIMYAAGHASRQTMQSYIRLGKIQMDADKVRAVFS